MTNSANRQASIDSRRIALEREISIRVPAFDTFVTEYSSNISTTGMFVRSDKPLAPDTQFVFEFSVADDWKLIRGKAQVVWTRFRTEADDRQAGMGIRFIELDPQSRRLIRWVVEKHIREGGKPFELEDLRSVIDEAISQVEGAEETQAPAPSESAQRAQPTWAPATRTVTPSSRPLRQEPRKRRYAALVLTAIAVVAIVGLLFWLTEPSEQAPGAVANGEAPSSREPASGETAMAGEAGATDAAATVTETATDAGARAAPLRSANEAERLVAAWSRAWSNQDVDAYLSHYSRDFQPASGISRSAWAAQRRERVGGPGFIEVTITSLVAEPIDDTHARVIFTQSYQSDRMSDQVRKTLDLVIEDGAWKIKSERMAQ